MILISKSVLSSCQFLYRSLSISAFVSKIQRANQNNTYILISSLNLKSHYFVIFSEIEALKNSLFINEINSTDIPLGQAASHS